MNPKTIKDAVCRYVSQIPPFYLILQFNSLIQNNNPHNFYLLWQCYFRLAFLSIVFLEISCNNQKYQNLSRIISVKQFPPSMELVFSNSISSSPIWDRAMNLVLLAMAVHTILALIIDFIFMTTTFTMNISTSTISFELSTTVPQHHSLFYKLFPQNF